MASKREHELRQAAAAGAVRRSEREKSDASWYSWYSLAECGTNPRPGSPPRLSIRRQLQPPALPLPARAACAAMQAALCCFQERTWHSRQQQGDFKGYSAGVWIFQHTGVHDPQRCRRRCGGGWAQLALQARPRPCAPAVRRLVAARAPLQLGYHNRRTPAGRRKSRQEMAVAAGPLPPQPLPGALARAQQPRHAAAGCALPP